MTTAHKQLELFLNIWIIYYRHSHWDWQTDLWCLIRNLGGLHAPTFMLILDRQESFG